jgi:hypothetical protein
MIIAEKLLIWHYTTLAHTENKDKIYSETCIN